MHIANQPVLLLKYDFLNWPQQNLLLNSPRMHEMSYLSYRGSFRCKKSLQLVLDITDASIRVVPSAIATKRASWLLNSGIVPDIQPILKDLS